VRLPPPWRPSDRFACGRRSPEPLAAAAVAGQDVVPEAEDTRLLELLRAQARAAVLCTGSPSVQA
jgi:hypothetical protein